MDFVLLKFFGRVNISWIWELVFCLRICILLYIIRILVLELYFISCLILVELMFLVLIFYILNNRVFNIL